MSDGLEALGRAAEPTAAVASPCVGLCRIEDPGDLCTGCGRSRDEIAAWGTMGEAARDRVWAALPGRREALGIGVHRMPWGAAEIRRFVEGRLRPGGGTWVFGAPGAEAAFAAATARGAVRFERMRALGFGPGTAAGRAGVVALVVPREEAADTGLPSGPKPALPPSAAPGRGASPPPVIPAGYALVALHQPDPSKDHHAD